MAAVVETDVAAATEVVVMVEEEEATEAIEATTETAVVAGAEC